MLSTIEFGSGRRMVIAYSTTVIVIILLVLRATASSLLRGMVTVWFLFILPEFRARIGVDVSCDFEMQYVLDNEPASRRANE